MPIPQGLFPALVVQLLQREEKPIFTLPHSTKEDQLEIDQLRNAIILSSESTSGAILLVDSVGSLFFWSKFRMSTDLSVMLFLRGFLKWLKSLATNLSYVAQEKDFFVVVMVASLQLLILAWYLLIKISPL